MAQRANDRPIQIAGLHEQAVEDAARRWRHGACFDLPDGRRQYIVSGPMHYQVGEAWEEIDNRWLPAAAPWDYQMLAAEYQARLVQRFDAGQILRLEKAGHYLTFQPMALSFTNDLDQIQQISMPQNVDGAVSNFGETGLCQQGRIDWPAGYGSGLDFAYIPSTHFFKKLLTVANPAALGAPQQYIIDGGNPVVALSFIFSSDLDLYVDGELWDRKERVESAERIEFRDGETLHWWWGVPRATDADGEEQPGTIELKKQGNSLYVSVRVPWAWLDAAAYPVEIDPDIYFGGTTDGFIYGSNANYATSRTDSAAHDDGGTYLWLGQRLKTGFFNALRVFLEFDTSGIVGAVSQANLYMSVQWDKSTTAEFDIEIAKCVWASPIAAGNREASYDAALAADVDVTWRNTAGINLNTQYGSPNLATAWIETDGTTQYALLSSREIGAIEPADDDEEIGINSHDDEEANRPYLSITEGAPPPTTVARHLVQAYMRSR